MPIGAKDGEQLGAVAYTKLKQDITLCRLAPGSEMTEAELAERYALGRAPIRHALARLRQEGLVRSMSRRGFVVAPITVRSVQENFSVRLMLEPQAAALAADRIEPKQLLLGDVPYPEEDDPERNLAFIRANREFHVAIAAATGNQKLTAIITGLLDEADRILHMVQFEPNLTPRERREQSASLGNHQDLIAALRARNPEAAAYACRVHLESSRDFVISRLMGGALI
jgi:DNA-binding GntR family transcriptional regulator